MADPKTNENEAAEETQTTEGEGLDGAQGKSKKPVLFLGAALGIVLLAFVAVKMASPGTTERLRFGGPFNAELFPEKFQVNLSGNGQKRFLQFVLNVIFEAYEENTVLQRAEDPLYEPFLQGTVLAVCSSKTVDELEGRANKDALMAEIRTELEPVLFPVFFGKATQALGADPDSGLRPGLSSERATFRGRYHDHVITLDVPAQTVQLDEGTVVSFSGNETDLVVEGVDGASLYLDVSELEPEFKGEIHAGVMGRIRRVMPKYFLVQ